MRVRIGRGQLLRVDGLPGAVDQNAHRGRSVALREWPLTAALMGYRLITAVLLAVGCAGEAGGQPGSGGAGGGGTRACVGTPVVTPKRVVRLSEHQLFGAYTSLFGIDAAEEITRNEDRPSLLERE